MEVDREQQGELTDAGAASTIAAPPARLIDRSVIHDLRNPLSAIAGNLQLLQASLEATLDAKNRNRLQACLSSVDELTGMLADLQYLVLLRSGELEPSFKPADIRALLKAVLQSTSGKPAQEGRYVSLTDGPPLCIPMMSQLVSRAIQNLVISALRVSKASPITIDLEDRPGEFGRVNVTYVGMSVPAPLSNHLFDLDWAQFQAQHGFRVDRARGLHFVRAIAELHGGEASYEPRSAGGRFTLTLPYQPAKPASA